MKYFLQSIDQFGVEYKLQIPPINPTQKSALGGLLTLTLYGISLAYFLVEFVDWQQNNKLPKITSLKQQIEVNQTIFLKGVFVEICYYQKLNNSIDPFDPNKLIFNPIFQVIPSNWNNIQNLTLRHQQEQQDNGKIINKFYIEDITIQRSPPTSSVVNALDYQLTFGFCQNNRLAEGQKCADEETIKQFLKQDNFFQVQIFIEQFDPKTKNFKKVPKFFVLDVQINRLFSNQYLLQQGELILDDGFLLPTEEKLSYLSDIQALIQTYDWEYSQKVFGENLVSLLYFNLDQIKIVNMVEYPKISEILADTGSIITWILSISFLVSKYNENLSMQNTQNEVIQMYYHDYIDFKIQKNWLGKIKSINYKEKEYDPKQSEEILNKLDQIVIKKINYLNLQNEVAKLQLILQEHLGLHQIKKYLESKNKLEFLFEKLCIPEKTSKQQINQIIEVNQTIFLKGVFVEICYYQKLNNSIDPFDPNKLIFNPIFQVIPSNWNNIQNLTLRHQQEQQDNGKIINKFYIEDITIQRSPPTSSVVNALDYQLTFGFCQNNRLAEGQKCADEETIKQFLKQDNFFQVQIFIEQFDPKTKNFKKVPKFFVLDVQINRLFSNQYLLQQGELILDDGFLLPTEEKLSYLSDIQALIQTYDWEYSQKVFGENLVSLLYFNLDQIKIVNMVEYPKISEILADTGSIITWILSISFLVSKYNENLSMQNTQNEVIQMYYHDYIDFKIQKNWQGKIKSINYKEKEYDPKQSEEILNKLDQIVIKKINYLNLQNEVAKLQLILQEHLGLHQIKKYLESKNKLEFLFEKLCIPEKTSKQQINQIHILNEQQSEGVSQLGGENAMRVNYNIILDQEVEEKIGLLSIKTSDNNQIEKHNSNQDISQPIHNYSTQFQVINIEQSMESK
ncbi:unnamed protein product [Paramecium sonneborni]|uniref:Uncharacterized protein n=1 Tax=Paramecium sonneborni TaxID=65129 RepID=A0A8S1PNT0_9CILI|nr:unnamed protein product [Paramecium sonneborni]